MHVTEIFFSIQGESTHAGRPCVFVRFTGCDLRCQYCDTEYSFYGGRQMTRAQILAEVAKYPTKFVCLTGGEPVLQKELPELAQELLDLGYEISLETHGQRPLDRIPRGVKKIVDLKTPGSEEPHTTFRELERLQPGDELKVVVCSESSTRSSGAPTRAGSERCESRSTSSTCSPTRRSAATRPGWSSTPASSMPGSCRRSPPR